jgi:membrane protein implicated in regulation of membrane protease activity
MALYAPIIWFIAGGILCLMEFTLPTGFMEFTLGISAIVVGILLLIFPQLSFSIQMIIWAILSVILAILVRRFMPKRSAPQLADAVEARTLTAIPPGNTGRVLYEGNSWAAQCDDEGLAIAADEKVYVLRRKGNTLIVMPERVLRNLPDAE